MVTRDPTLCWGGAAELGPSFTASSTAPRRPLRSPDLGPVNCGVVLLVMGEGMGWARGQGRWKSGPGQQQGLKSFKPRLGFNSLALGQKHPKIPPQDGSGAETPAGLRRAERLGAGSSCPAAPNSLPTLRALGSPILRGSLAQSEGEGWQMCSRSCFTQGGLVSSGHTRCQFPGGRMKHLKSGPQRPRLKQEVGSGLPGRAAGAQWPWAFPAAGGDRSCPVTLSMLPELSEAGLHHSCATGATGLPLDSPVPRGAAVCWPP